MANDERLKQYHELFVDCWQFVKANIEISDDISYWKNIKEEAEALYEKHKGTNADMIKQIVVTFYGDQQKRKVEEFNNA